MQVIVRFRHVAKSSGSRGLSRHLYVHDVYVRLILHALTALFHTEPVMSVARAESHGVQTSGRASSPTTATAS